MELFTVDTGFFKLDGGAMFGVVPKSIWSRTNPADENNLCPWAMRCLLVSEGNTDIILVQGLSPLSDRILADIWFHVSSVACTGQMFVVQAICDNWV